MNTLQTHTETMTNILNSFATYHDSMNAGDRVSLLDLSINVGTSTGLDPKAVKGFTDYFAHNNGEEGYVSPGRFGGYIKGQRVLKGSKKTTQDSSTDSQ